MTLGTPISNGPQAQPVFATPGLKLNATTALAPPPTKPITPAPVAITQRQARSMMEFRKMLNANISQVTGRKVQVPEILAEEDLKLESMLEKLAPYHILQDSEHTSTALQKTDKLLDKALSCLVKRSENALTVANAILLKESHKAHHSPVEDRILLERMELDLQREVFEAEKKSFERAMKAFHRRDDSESDYEPDMSNIPVPRRGRKRRKRDPAETPARKQLLDVHGNPLAAEVITGLGKLAEFVPLNFDAEGQASRARLNLEKTKNDDSDSSALLIFSTDFASNHKTDSQRSATTASQTPSFDETYNLWQELMMQEQEEQFLRTDASPTNDVGLVHFRISLEAIFLSISFRDIIIGEFKFLVSELNGELSHEWSGLKYENGFSSYGTMREEVSEQSRSRNVSGGDAALIAAAQDLEAEFAAESMMSEENTAPQQHSEDPDIDAAIRSILTPTD
ncbi:hypothetical protein Ciccas_005488 [Cichlidogyrus casuarinus]|uniref:Uncharacterized protein n=1 Tax=Cichlidogyrus casuarinus TaxID=1844966 RepID=A0ABD2Q8J2_9PLAT